MGNGSRFLGDSPSQCLSSHGLAEFCVAHKLVAYLKMFEHVRVLANCYEIPKTKAEFLREMEVDFGKIRHLYAFSGMP